LSSYGKHKLRLVGAAAVVHLKEKPAKDGEHLRVVKIRGRERVPSAAQPRLLQPRSGAGAVVGGSAGAAVTISPREKNSKLRNPKLNKNQEFSDAVRWGARGARTGAKSGANESTSSGVHYHARERIFSKE
jgi:hypothetical protein